MTDQTFAALRKNYDSVGYTLDPSGAGQVVRMSGGKQVVVEGQDVGLEVLSKQGLGNKDKKGVEAGKKRLKNGDPSDVNGYLGPWAGYEGEVRGEISGPTEEELKAAGFETLDGEGGAAGGSGAEKGKEKDFAAGSERTIFHGKSERDYLGRTYMHPPSDVDVNLLGEPGMLLIFLLFVKRKVVVALTSSHFFFTIGSQECSLPKRLLHTYTGHNNGVNAIRFLPKTAHLLLSAGMEGKAKLWDVYHDRQCLRTFIGHTKAIRDICFNNAGTQFLTASYDRWIKLWDTETGQCIKTFTTHKTPYCVRFHPEEDKQHIFLTGCSDKKVHQFDMNTGEVIQEYDQHLGAVNTITFVDDNRRFITTSDDKTLRAWEYDIPVVIKYVADPTMHSMPAVTLSPNKKWLSCQSLDNAVYIYSARDRFRLNRKKRFTGHLVAGFACQTAFSPDGQFLTSGDSEGKVIFWDWKTCKIRRYVFIYFACSFRMNFF